RWVIVSDGAPLAEGLARRLGATGDTIEVLPRRDRPRFADLGPVDRVVYLHALLDEPFAPADDGVDEGTLALAELARDLAALDARATPRLDVVTAGIQRVSGEDSVAHPEHAAALGLLRVVQKECWRLRARSIDLPRPTRDADLDLLASQLAAPPVEP